MKLNREILRLSLPSIISNISVPLLGLSDTAISGHLGSEKFIAAIAVGTMMFNVVFWLFGFFRMGTTGMTAQEYGRKNNRQCNILLYRSIFIALAIGLLLIALQYPIQWLLMNFISPEQAVVDLARNYFYICIWGAPAILINMSVSGWFIGMQNSFATMLISIGVNVLNILLSLLFVFVADVGFIGVAIGTLSANWIGVGVSILLIWRYNKNRFPIIEIDEILKVEDLKHFFKINTDIFFRSACIMSVSLSITAFGAHISSLTLAANTIMMQFFIMFSYFMDGLAFTGEALVGRYAGATDWNMMKCAVKRLCQWAAVIAIVFTLGYIVCYEYIVRMITSNINVIVEIEEYKQWIIILPFVTVAAFIFDGVYIGLTRTRTMLIVTLISTFVFYLISFIHPLSENVISYPANHTLWIAFLSYLLLRGLLLAGNYIVAYRNKA